MYPKYGKKAFNNIVTGDETWVYYFEPKWKIANQIWATKNANQTNTNGKEGFVCYFFTTKGPAIQIPVPKGRTVIGKFYKNVVLRKLKNYYKSHRPKEYLSMSHFCMIMHPLTRHVL